MMAGARGELGSRKAKARAAATILLLKFRDRPGGGSATKMW
jgi:hypothetical protein